MQIEEQLPLDNELCSIISWREMDCVRMNQTLSENNLITYIMGLFVGRLNQCLKSNESLARST